MAWLQRHLHAGWTGKLVRRALVRAHRRLFLDRLSGRRSVEAHVGVGVAGQHHRHSSEVRIRAGLRQDVVLPAFHDLHQSHPLTRIPLCSIDRRHGVALLAAVMHGRRAKPGPSGAGAWSPQAHRQSVGRHIRCRRATWRASPRRAYGRPPQRPSGGSVWRSSRPRS